MQLAAQVRGLQCIPDGCLQFVEIDRLAHEVVRAQLEGCFHVVELRIGRNHDDGARVACLLQLIQHLNAGKVGHADVEQREVGGFLARQAKSRFARVSFDNDVTPLFALLPQRPAHEPLVIHDHYFFDSHSMLLINCTPKPRKFGSAFSFRHSGPGSTYGRGEGKPARRIALKMSGSY